MKQARFGWLLAFLLFSTGCTILDSGDEVTVKVGDQQAQDQSKKKNQLLVDFDVARDLSGILKEGPGKYVDQDGMQGSLPKGVKKELNTLPEGMEADVAYNQLIYLLAQNHRFFNERLHHYDPGILINGERERPEPPQGKLIVNVVLLIDAGKELGQPSPDSKYKKMDILRLQIKQSLRALAKQQSEKISYRVMIQTYGGLVGTYSDLVPVNQVESKIFPQLEEIQPGGVGRLEDTLKQVHKTLRAHKQPNVLNQVFIISAGKDSLEPDPSKETEEIQNSDAQGHVHVVDYGITDRRQKEKLHAIPDKSLGEYIIADTKAEGLIDFSDQQDRNQDGYNPRDYSQYKEHPWGKVRGELKVEQVERLIPMHEKEYDQLKIATQNLARMGKVDDVQKRLLLEMIEQRRSLLEAHFDSKLKIRKREALTQAFRLGVDR